MAQIAPVQIKYLVVDISHGACIVGHLQHEELFHDMDTSTLGVGSVIEVEFKKYVVHTVSISQG
ncbi:MAG: hypothetical protein ABF497_05495 [Sporolactobacillus sp.]